MLQRLLRYARQLKVQIDPWLDPQRLPEWGRTLLSTAALGILVGLAAVLLHRAIDVMFRSLLLSALSTDKDLGSLPNHAWLILLVPTLGGLAAGWLVAHTEPEAAGGGTDLVVERFHQDRLDLGLLGLPVKIVAAALAIGSGITGGGEGPASYLGAGLGGRFGRFFGLSAAEQRRLYTAGMAAGVAAIFRSPLGGALFACECYYSDPDLEADALLTAVLAAVASYTVFGAFEGFDPLLALGSASLPPSFAAFGLLSLMGLLAAGLARALVGSVHSFKRTLQPVPLAYRPALGGLLIGFTVWVALLVEGQAHLSPDRPGLSLAALSEGYPFLKLATGALLPALPALLMLLVLRFITTGLALSSASPVGAFAPVMVLGALLGMAFGALAKVAGLAWATPDTLALCAMAGLFSAAFRSPLAAMVMILEVGQGYHLLPALMWSSALGYLLGPKHGLIETQRPHRSAAT